MQEGIVYRNAYPIGEIKKRDDGLYLFQYSQEYLSSQDARPISVTLPLTKEPFESETLFAFFFNMLSEGNTKQMQCRSMKIDENDHFTRLLKTAGENTIGAITVKEKE